MRMAKWSVIQQVVEDFTRSGWAEAGNGIRGQMFQVSIEPLNSAHLAPLLLIAAMLY